MSISILLYWWRSDYSIFDVKTSEVFTVYMQIYVNVYTNGGWLLLAYIRKYVGNFDLTEMV